MLGADRRARFVRVVSMQVVALIEVRVGDRGRWLRHRKGAGETPDESPVAMRAGGPMRVARMRVGGPFRPPISAPSPGISPHPDGGFCPVRETRNEIRGIDCESDPAGVQSVALS